MSLYKCTKGKKATVGGVALSEGQLGQEGFLGLLLTLVGFPLSLGYFHQKVFVFDGNKVSQSPHGVLKIRVEQDLSQSLYQGCASSMEDVKACGWR